MANPEHVEILKQGVEAWNAWREANPSVKPDLGEADLSQADLSGANLSGAILNYANLKKAYLVDARLDDALLEFANLNGANLKKAFLVDARLPMANLSGANLSGADLSGAIFRGANLIGADLSEAELNGADLVVAKLIGANLASADLGSATLLQADLSRANLSRANLHMAFLERANFSGANLVDARLMRASLIDTNLESATLNGCYIYGISVWNVNLSGANQSNLIITNYGEPQITVDNLEVAQFIYLLLNNSEIRNVIDTITSKAVLILGRFTEERKVVLDALRDELRKRDYLPILFDFEKPGSRDLTETISTLAHMARFIIADITDAKSIPQELQAIVPNLPSVAVQPVIARDAYEYAMFEHFKRYPWVLATYQYDDTEQLLTSLAAHVIEPAEAKVKELRGGS